MNKLKFFPMINGRPKCNLISQQISKVVGSIFTENPKDADIILVGGGDGSMLDAISKLADLNKPFFGINCGTLGFLMNNIESISQLPNFLEDLEIIKKSFIKVTVKTRSGKQIIKYAINDVVFGNAIWGRFNFTLKGKQINQNIDGTGMLISTSLGSTGYWLNNGGPDLPLELDIWGIMGIASKPFNYKTLEPENIHINWKSKDPLCVAIDGFSGLIKDILEVNISPSKKQMEIGFLKSENFKMKRLRQVEQKIGGN